MLVDSHCHLDYPDFKDDLDEVIARARDVGVKRFLTISTKLSEFSSVLSVAERYDDVFCAVGVHPHAANEEGLETAEPLLDFTKHPKVVAIGESGLDYFYSHGDPQKQRRSFRAHCQACRETGLPLVVHTRDADEDTVQILQEEQKKGPFTGVIHCYTAGWPLAEAALEMGFYISVSGIATFPKSKDLAERLAKVPLDRLLVETDAPFLSPVPKRGKRNEPSFVAHTADFLAELKEVSPEEIRARTGENFLRLFTKVGNFN